MLNHFIMWMFYMNYHSKHSSFKKFAYGACLLWLLLSIPITAYDWQNRWYTAGHETKYFIKLYIYWAQYAAVPLLIAFICQCRTPVLQWKNLISTIFILPTCALIWGGLVEPHLLKVAHNHIQTQAKGAQNI